MYTPPPGVNASTPPRVLESRYPGKCVSCKRTFNAGETIAYFDLIGKALCPLCTRVWQELEEVGINQWG